MADLQGEDKQKAAAEALDALVPLPWFLEWADGPIFKFLIGLAVQKLNAEHGHDWSGVDVLREAGATRGLSTYERGLLNWTCVPLLVVLLLLTFSLLRLRQRVRRWMSTFFPLLRLVAVTMCILRTTTFCLVQ